MGLQVERREESGFSIPSLCEPNKVILWSEELFVRLSNLLLSLSLICIAKAEMRDATNQLMVLLVAELAR